jgi:hypothetical protein
MAASAVHRRRLRRMSQDPCQGTESRATSSRSCRGMAGALPSLLAAPGEMAGSTVGDGGFYGRSTCVDAATGTVK